MLSSGKNLFLLQLLKQCVGQRSYLYVIDREMEAELLNDPSEVI